MARYIGAVCKLCRREGGKLYLKGERCFTEKCAVSRRPYPPGMHGRGRIRESEYMLQLREKQKAKRIYGMLEKQFRNLYAEAARQKGITGETLLRMLEQRLDNVVFRANFSASRNQARQFVRHGHVLVNGKRVDIPSYRVRKGDIITIRDKARQMVVVQWNRDVLDRRPPAWLESAEEGYAVNVVSLPAREQIEEAPQVPECIAEVPAGRTSDAPDRVERLGGRRVRVERFARFRHRHPGL